VDFDLVLALGSGDRLLHRGSANQFNPVLSEVGVGHGRYAFRHEFPTALSVEERDRLVVRPAGSNWELELAPALVTEPPRVRFQGYVDARSIRHVAGWVRNLTDADERLAVEVVLPDARGGERVLWRGTANRPSAVLREVGVGDGDYSFHAMLPEVLDMAARDAVFVRPEGSAFRLELAPALVTAFEPISHVALDIVDNCNLRCPFCVVDYADTHRTRFMTDEVFESALRLLPYVTDGNFWLSCLHEATLHPRLLDFIAMVPRAYRHKLFYTTNLAKRMPPSYFAALAKSGMHHLNISLESLDPAIYERMCKGARHRIFAANWELLLDAFAATRAAPRLRYNVMAYRSNLREIPGLVEILLRDRHAWQVEIRHTYDEPHIPAGFREAEFLSTAEWSWLGEQLRHWSPERVLLLVPPGGIGHDRDPERPAPPDVRTALEPSATSPVRNGVPRPLNLSMSWDGTLRVYGEEPRGPGGAPRHVNYVSTAITGLDDPLQFLMSL